MTKEQANKIIGALYIISINLFAITVAICAVAIALK
jgi:hypothetical protein